MEESDNESDFPETVTVVGNLTSAAAMYFEIVVVVLSNKVFVTVLLNASPLVVGARTASILVTFH